MKDINNKVFPTERALYNSSDICLINCRFEGDEDGESALKESKNIKLLNCFMDLRYPLWHDSNVDIIDCVMSEKCRAALWYTKDVSINNSQFAGVKALSECENINIFNSVINSQEFGWKSKNINCSKTKIQGEYAFFESSNVILKEVDFSGKYSFQYVSNLIIDDCVLNTKDAFWHINGGVVRNSVIKGEYLGWYSKNLTFINCQIIGTQPLCYCEGLRLIDCTMEKCDFAFEYSSLEASVKGEILSVKNPKSGSIIADKILEVIQTDDIVMECDAKISIRK